MNKPRYIAAIDDATGAPCVLSRNRDNNGSPKNAWWRLSVTTARNAAANRRAACAEALSPEANKRCHVTRSNRFDGAENVFIAIGTSDLELIPSSEEITGLEQWISVADELSRLAELDEACDMALGLAAVWREDHRDERDM